MLSKYFTLGALAVSKTATASNCPTCWIEEGDGCVPDPQQYVLSCTGTKLDLQLEKCVFEGAIDVSELVLNESTSAACDNVNGLKVEEFDGGWRATSDLDCSALEAETSTPEESHLDQDGNKVITQSEVSVLRFSNRLTWGGDDGAHELITFANSLYLDFTCSYDANYEVAEEYAVEQSVTGGSSADTGKFDFSLEQYTDSTYSLVRDANAGSHRIGSTLFFGVKISESVQVVEFSTLECKVTSKADDTKVLTILENGKPAGDNIVALTVDDNPSKTLNKFSFMVFEFRGVELGMGMTLSCKVKACDANDAENVCQSSRSDYCINQKETALKAVDSRLEISEVWDYARSNDQHIQDNYMKQAFSSPTAKRLGDGFKQAYSYVFLVKGDDSDESKACAEALCLKQENVFGQAGEVIPPEHGNYNTFTQWVRGDIGNYGVIICQVKHYYN